AKRAIEALLAEDFEIKVLVLPAGGDPDEFIRTEGVEEYQRRRGEALPHIQFVLDQATGGRNLHRPAEKAQAVEEVLPFVRAVRNQIQKREYFDMAMDALRVDERGLRSELWQAVKAGGAADAKSIGQKVSRAVGARPTVAEQQLLELLVHDRALRREVLPRMEPADYEDLPTAAVFRALIEIENEGGEVDFASLSAKTGDDVLAADVVPLVLMAESRREEDEAVDDVLAAAEGCLHALRLMSIDRRISELSTEIAAAERAGDSERRDQLALEHLEWTRRKMQMSEVRGY
ncbi:MAG TPA: hypothetical protein VF507_02125, partial [Pyrinomonadaceae bacterium]